jgi:N-acetylglutamate synthase/N-acetylornithine aminotransferase
MRNMIAIVISLMLFGCVTTQQTIAPPIFSGIPSEFVEDTIIMPKIDVDTASQDEISYWVGLLGKKVIILEEQRKAVKDIDEQYKKLYDQYLQQVNKGK